MGSALTVIGAVMVVASFALWRFVGIPETTTISADGVSTSISWGHVVGYAALGIVGAFLVHLGRTSNS